VDGDLVMVGRSQQISEHKATKFSDASDSGRIDTSADLKGNSSPTGVGWAKMGL
jgi:hypothetical protein